MMNRARSSALLSLCLTATCATTLLVPASSLAAQTRRTTDSTHMYDVQIKPSTRTAEDATIEAGADSWRARGVDLKSLLAEIYSVDPSRVALPSNLRADARYDVNLKLAKEESPETTAHLLQAALQKNFGLVIAVETRSTPVYVLSAPNGAGPALRTHSARGRSSGEELPQISYEGRSCPGIYTGSIAVVNGSMAEFSRTWEPALDRPVVDETNLAGAYDFKVENYTSKTDLFQKLHDQLGLVVTPTERSVTVLTVRSAAPDTMLIAEKSGL